MRPTANVFLLSFVCLLPAAASAHEIGLSNGAYEVTSSSVTARVAFAHGELIASHEDLDVDGDEKLTASEVAAAWQVLDAAIVQRLEVRADGRRCPGTLTAAAITENDGLLVSAGFDCGSISSRVDVDPRFIETLSNGHRHLVQGKGAGVTMNTVVFRGRRTFAISTVPSAAQQDSTGLGTMFLLGVEHILIGIDHLVFLLGVILIGGRLRSMVGVITAFTVGHSITLGLASLGIWTPSGNVVEPLIALSIVYVGVENFFVKNVDKRWYLTGLFGLVHGFGFAGVLAEIGLPADSVVSSLLAFNLGVEAGQLLVLLPLLPALYLARKARSFNAYGIPATSALIVLLGAVWFIERVM